MTNSVIVRPHIPRPRSSARNKRWWLKFASPKWLLLGVPAMVFPALLAFVGNDVTPPSAVEVAVASLPMSGDATDPETGKAVNPFGPQAGNVPVSVSSSLYARSAQVAAVHPMVQSEHQHQEEDVVDYNVTVFNALHPRSLADEDLLSVGAALQHMPTGANFASIVYRELCMAQPGGPGEFGKIGVNNSLMTSLLNYMPLAEIARACPQLH